MSWCNRAVHSPLACAAVHCVPPEPVTATAARRQQTVKDSASESCSVATPRGWALTCSSIVVCTPSESTSHSCREKVWHSCTLSSAACRLAPAQPRLPGQPFSGPGGGQGRAGCGRSLGFLVTSRMKPPPPAPASVYPCSQTPTSTSLLSKARQLEERSADLEVRGHGGEGPGDERRLDAVASHQLLLRPVRRDAPREGFDIAAEHRGLDRLRIRDLRHSPRLREAQTGVTWGAAAGSVRALTRSQACLTRSTGRRDEEKAPGWRRCRRLRAGARPSAGGHPAAGCAPAARGRSSRARGGC